MLHKLLSLLLAVPLLSSAGAMAADADNTRGSRGLDEAVDLAARHRPDRPRRIIIQNASHLPPCYQGPILLPPVACPDGSVLVLFDKPVYDEDGLFVVCLEKVPFCIPEGLSPEG